MKPPITRCDTIASNFPRVTLPTHTINDQHFCRGMNSRWAPSWFHKSDLSTARYFIYGAIDHCKSGVIAAKNHARCRGDKTARDGLTCFSVGSVREATSEAVQKRRGCNKVWLTMTEKHPHDKCAVIGVQTLLYKGY